jgi:hypothetical protein
MKPGLTQWKTVVTLWTVIIVWLSNFCNGKAQRHKVMVECRNIVASRAQLNSSFSAGSVLGCMLCADLDTKNIVDADGKSAPLKVPNNSENAFAFSTIYKDMVWTSDGGGSGAGSDPEFAMGAIHILQLVIHKYGIISLLDAPCGAVHSSWMRVALDQLRSDIPCFKYFGVDVVGSVIQKNKERFNNQSSWIQFATMDLSGSVQLPKGYSIILSRDALQHLPYRGIAGAFNTYCASESTYLLVGSYIDTTNKNKDIGTPGGCFDINLLSEPFSFPKPFQVFAEKGLPQQLRAAELYPRKYLLLYHLSTLCQSAEVKTFIANYSRTGV